MGTHKTLNWITVARLHKELGKLIEQGHGRLYVSVNKDTFQDNRELDGVVILPVNRVVVQHVPQADDDGGIKVNADGSESYRRTAVLVGYSWEPPQNKET